MTSDGVIVQCFRGKVSSMSTATSNPVPATPPKRDPFAALRQRNYRLYFMGQFISMCGTWLQMVAQGWLVWELTHNQLSVGLVTAAGSLPMLLFALAGGAVADRVDRRKLLQVTQTCAMVLAALLGVLALQPGVQVWHIGVVAACLGVVSAFDMPARQAFVVQTVDRETLLNAVALNSVLFNGARIVGPALASLCIAVPWLGVSGCFFLNSASYIAALIALGRIRVVHEPRPASRESRVQELLGGIRYVTGTPVIRRLMTLLAVVGLFGWSISVVMPAMAERVLGGGAGTYGLLTTANGVGAMLGALFLASVGDTPHKRRMVYGGLVLMCVALLGFSLARWIPLSAVLIGVAGSGTLLYAATSNTVVQSMVPDELRGRVMGMWSLVFAGTSPIGSLLMGWMAGQWGAPVAIRVAAVIVLGCCGLVFLESHHSRAREAQERMRAPRRARA